MLSSDNVYMIMMTKGLLIHRPIVTDLSYTKILRGFVKLKKRLSLNSDFFLFFGNVFFLFFCVVFFGFLDFFYLDKTPQRAIIFSQTLQEDLTLTIVDIGSTESKRRWSPFTFNRVFGVSFFYYLK